MAERRIDNLQKNVGNSLELMKVGAEIEKGKPSFEQDIGDIFKRTGQQIKPKNVKSGLVSGFLEGFGQGIQREGKKKGHEKLEEDYNKLKSMNDDIMEKNNKYAQKEYQNFVVQDSANSYAVLQKGGASVPEKNNFAQKFIRPKLMEAGLMSERGELQATEGSIIVVTEPGKPPMAIDTRTLMSPEAVESEKQQQLIEYQNRGLANQERGLNIQQQNADTTKANKDLENEKLREEINQLRGQNPQNNGNIQPIKVEGIELNPIVSGVPINKYGKKGLPKESRAHMDSTAGLASYATIGFKALDKAEEITKNNPDLLTPWSEKAPKTWNKKERQNAMAKLTKISSDLAEGIIKAKGANISDGERETIKKLVPSWDLPDEARLSNIRQLREMLLRTKKQAIYNRIGLSQGIDPDRSSGFEEFIEANPNFSADLNKKYLGNDWQLKLDETHAFQGNAPQDSGAFSWLPTD